MNRILCVGFSFFLSLLSFSAFAAAYSVPPPSQSLIGEMRYTLAQSGDTVVTLAQRYDIGFNAIQDANPFLNLSKGFSSGASVKIPTQHLLPNLPRRGIVINLPEMRMYYYPAGSNEVLTYPIGIGKIGRTIPIENTVITRKTKDPVWTPTQNIREFNLQQGIVLPKVMPAGPDNPLGPYAIYMRIPTYLIHSTIFPDSVGKRASFGCIRMYEEDIQDFFPSIEHGIPVAIVNSPVKVGWEDNALYMEAHQPLEEHSASFNASLPGIVQLVHRVAHSPHVLVDWQMVSYIAKYRDGVPHQIGIKLSQ